MSKRSTRTALTRRRVSAPQRARARGTREIVKEARARAARLMTGALRMTKRRPGRTVLGAFAAGLAIATLVRSIA